MTTMNMGEEGFWWFMGTVEDREDPLRLGRVRVRIHNIHSSKKTEMPSDLLPWALPVLPMTSASLASVGVSPTGIQVGSTVFGFFVDGRASQHPVILGTMPGIPGGKEETHDVPTEAREINNVVKETVGPEPATAYGAKYPYNKVFRTEGGHVIEIDDTPNAERVHVFHKSGSYTEIDYTGRTVCKSVGDRFEIDVKDNNVYVGGNVNLQVKGNVTATVEGTTMWKCPQTTFDGNVTVTGHTNIQRGLSVVGSNGGASAAITGNVQVNGTIESSGDITAPAFHGVADAALDGLDN